MASTIQNYRAFFGSGPDVAARYVEGTVLTGQGVLGKGTLLYLDSADNKYKIFDAVTTIVGVAVLLEEADTTSGDVVAKIGVAGEIAEADLVFEGTITEINEYVRAILRMNNIFVQAYTEAFEPVV